MALRALLLAERARSCRGSSQRLTAIIKELQRHRFGRRAERLDPEQLALALEDVEQTLAAADAAAENDTHRSEASYAAQAAHQSRCAAGPPPTRRDRHRRGRQDLRVLRRPQAPDRRGRLGTARRYPGAVQGDRDAPSQICLPGLRWRSGASAGAGAADRERHSPPRHWSRMCWSPNMPITRRSIVKRKSMHAKASRSIAPPWRTG